MSDRDRRSNRPDLTSAGQLPAHLFFVGFSFGELRPFEDTMRPMRNNSCFIASIFCEIRLFENSSLNVLLMVMVLFNSPCTWNELTFGPVKLGMYYWNLILKRPDNHVAGDILEIFKSNQMQAIGAAEGYCDRAGILSQ